MITYSHRVAFAILPKISGALSMLGSLSIIVDIMKSPTKQQRTYCRLLLGSSVFDFITSLMYFLSTWPIPASNAPLYSSGTTATCTTQGFFVQMSLAVPIYNLGLAIYYFLVLVKNWSDGNLRRLENVLHFVAIAIGVGTAIAGLPLRLYNNSNLWCWISSLPQDCLGGNSPPLDEEEAPVPECQRGQNAWIYRWAFYYGPLWTIIFAITIIMGYVTYHVIRIDRRANKWRLDATTTTTTSSRTMTTPTTANKHDSPQVTLERPHNQDTTQQRRPQRQPSSTITGNKTTLSSRVFWRSIHYVLAFYVTWIFPTILRLLQTIGKEVPIGVILGMCVCLPLQGFWNGLIYQHGLRNSSVTGISSRRLSSTASSRRRLVSSTATTTGPSSIRRLVMAAAASSSSSSSTALTGNKLRKSSATTRADNDDEIPIPSAPSQENTITNNKRDHNQENMFILPPPPPPPPPPPSMEEDISRELSHTSVTFFDESAPLELEDQPDGPSLGLSID